MARENAYKKSLLWVISALFIAQSFQNDLCILDDFLLEFY